MLCMSITRTFLHMGLLNNVQNLACPTKGRIYVYVYIPTHRFCLYFYHLHLKSFSLTDTAMKHNSDTSDYCTTSYNQEHPKEVDGEPSVL